MDDESGCGSTPELGEIRLVLSKRHIKFHCLSGKFHVDQMREGQTFNKDGCEVRLKKLCWVEPINHRNHVTERFTFVIEQGQFKDPRDNCHDPGTEFHVFRLWENDKQQHDGWHHRVGAIPTQFAAEPETEWRPKQKSGSARPTETGGEPIESNPPSETT